ncbi:hypothetical protein RI367_005100 [Sorochytrium milnesiophthora]
MASVPAALLTGRTRLLSSSAGGVTDDEAVTTNVTATSSLGATAEALAAKAGLADNQFATGSIAVTVVAAVIAAARILGDVALDVLKKKLVVHAEFDSVDESYLWMMNWLANQSYGKQCSHFAVRSNLARMSSASTHSSIEEESNDVETSTDAVVPARRIIYIPGTGTHFLWYQRRFCWISRTRNSPPGAISQAVTEQLTLSMFRWPGGNARRLLESIVRTAQRDFLLRDQSRTVIHTGDQYGCWRRVVSKPIRHLSSVILDAQIKSDVVRDAEQFLVSERWYAEVGVPYRRGYLLYGPPGTGKTSFVTALAGHLKLNVYMLNLSSKALTDANVIDLMIDAPPRCILLLEDIHAVFHPPAANKSSPPSPTSSPAPSADGSESDKPAGGGYKYTAPEMTSASGVSFSTLLNILDGVIASEGRLLFMTSNSTDLDPAILRPGRIDRRVYLGNATRAMASELFVRFYSEHTAQQPTSEEKPHRNVQEMAADFANRLPNEQFSPAHVVGYLMQYRSDPRAAVDNAGELASYTAMRRV